MINEPGLLERHRAAVLLHELTRPASAAVISRLPARPGTAALAADVRRETGLPIKEFWTAVQRLQVVGAISRAGDSIGLDHDHLRRLVDRLVDDSPLTKIITVRPRLRTFVQFGRVTRMPTEPGLIDELYDALADLFEPGEVLPEAEVNARIATVHDDPAEIRRGLVDRGLLLREPGSVVYRAP